MLTYKRNDPLANT